LILSPQGVAPDKDTVGFNALVKNVTQAFSESFSQELAARNYHTVNVLDQQPGLDTGQKMAVYSVKHSAVIVAIPTIETRSVGADSQIQLRIQFIEGELMFGKSSPEGLRARTTIEKSYVLRGSVSGDTAMSMSDIARDYARFLESAGRIKQ